MILNYSYTRIYMDKYVLKILIIPSYLNNINNDQCLNTKNFNNI